MGAIDIIVLVGAVAIVVAVAVAAIVRRKKGKCSCDGCCEGCPHCAHRQK